MAQPTDQSAINNQQPTIRPKPAPSKLASFGETSALEEAWPYGSYRPAKDGSGAGTVNGTTLDWNAQGTVAQGTLSCPFTFANGQAAQNPAGVRIVYSGTVCGIPVSGDEV